MALVFARVELLGSPSFADYEKLHAAMKAIGFVQTIPHPNGGTYTLPHACYSGSKADTVDSASHAIHKAAATVQTGFLIFVCPVSTWTGYLNKA